MKKTIILVVPTNVVKPTAEVIAQPIKLVRVFLQYPLSIPMLNILH
jgi:hypothetical protein